METAPTDTDTSAASSGPAGTETTAGTETDIGDHGYGYGPDRLHRAGDGRMLAGVAQGVADYFDVDPTLVRIGFVVMSFLGGLAVPLYLAGWLLIPAEGADASVAEELLAHERTR
jgi:phage shock protein PspC (stress-responsive transcriptional regulator)